MLAIRLHPDRQLRFHDEPIPTPGPAEVLIRVTEVGLCGSDRHWLSRRSTPDAFRRAVELAEARFVDLPGLITLRVPLAEATRAFDALATRDGLKAIVEPASR